MEELVSKRLGLVWLGVLLVVTVMCQSTISRSEALLKVANDHELSIIIPASLDDYTIDRLPTASWSLRRQIDYLLDGSSHVARIQGPVIVLMRQSTLYGYIQDSRSGERLAHATIHQVDNDAFVSSNKDGYYSLTFVGDSVELEVTYVGYETTIRTIHSHEAATPVAISLTAANGLPTITISDQLRGATDSLLLVGFDSPDLIVEQNQASSAVGGEPDIFQAVLRQPGITAGADGLGGLHVRGGAHGHNLVTIDGVPLYQSAHAFGVYSIVNNTIVDRAYVHKQGITEDQAGRLASVIDIRLRNPDLSQSSLTIQSSTLASQLSANVPISKGRSGLTVAARRSHVDPIIRRISRDYKASVGDEGSSLLAFDDQYVKWQYRPDDRQRLTAMYYRSADRYQDETSFIFDNPNATFGRFSESTDVSWSNHVAQLSYQSTIGSRSIAKVSLSRYKYSYRNDYDNLSIDRVDSPQPLYDRTITNYQSGITSYRLSTGLETTHSTWRHHYGLTIAARQYQAGDLALELGADEPLTTPPPEPPILSQFVLGGYTSQELALYYSGDLRLTQQLRINGGLRSTLFNSIDRTYDEAVTYLTGAGFLQIAYQTTPSTVLGLRTSTTAQHDHLLTAGDNAYPSDLWLPSTIRTPPSQSWQGEIFVSQRLDQGYIRASVYHKQVQGMVLYDTLAVLPALTILEGDTWEEETFLADASSTGVEIQSGWQLSSKVDARLSYTWSRTDFLFGGDLAVPYDYDMPHVANMAIAYRPSPRWRIHLDWLYASGRPYTLYLTNLVYTPLSQDSALDALQVSDYNTDRLPATHKLNIAGDYSWQGRNATHQISIGIQNLYNRQNILYRYELDGLGIRDQASFPMLPMLRWTSSLGG